MDYILMLIYCLWLSLH